MTLSRLTLSMLKVAYGALFVVVLPFLLWRWSVRLDRWVPLHVPQVSPFGEMLVAVGALLMIAGMYALWRYGGGLPMSAFPPERLVARGVYRVVADPLYVGAVAISFGLSLACDSPAGTWIVSPLFAAGCVAWVIGFERSRTRERFGTVATPLLRLPADVDDPPDPWQRAAIYVLVFLPWLLTYMPVEALGAPPGAPSSALPIDERIPVLPWTAVIYEFIYVMVLAAPLVAKRQRHLRQFARRGLWAVAVIIPFYLLVPVQYEPRPLPGSGLFVDWMNLERAISSPLTAFPAFHFTWACIAAAFYAATWQRAWLPWAVAMAIGVSCTTVGIHSVADVVAGGAAFAIVAYGPTIWHLIRGAAERGANSWREWRLGPVRLMSHGLFIGLALVVSFPIAIWLGGPHVMWWTLAATLTGAVTAALWAQLIEGSPQLLRPFGYFGGVIGVLATVGVAKIVHADAWRFFAAYLVALAFGQGLGRLRCLVNGCCHGAPAPTSVGIRYLHPMPRPTRLAKLGGVPIHPTQIYALLWLVVVGCVLVRLWLYAVPLSFIVGMYFVLVGLGRFVEEHYRGEPQTAVIAGFRMYQWLTFLFIFGGAVTTTLPTAPAPAPTPLTWTPIFVATVAALLGVVSFGMDVPASNRRFSRLA